MLVGQEGPIFCVADARRGLDLTVAAPDIALLIEAAETVFERRINTVLRLAAYSNLTHKTLHNVRILANAWQDSSSRSRSTTDTLETRIRTAQAASSAHHQTSAAADESGPDNRQTCNILIYVQI